MGRPGGAAGPLELAAVGDVRRRGLRRHRRAPGQPAARIAGGAPAGRTSAGAAARPSRAGAVTGTTSLGARMDRPGALDRLRHCAGPAAAHAAALTAWA